MDSKDGQLALSDNCNEAGAVHNTHLATPASSEDAKPLAAQKKSLRFYAIIVALSFTGLLTALEATITSTALPTIIDVLGGADLYIWVVNVYFLTMYILSPLPSAIAFAHMTVQDCIPASLRATCQCLRTTLSHHCCYSSLLSG